MIVLDTTAKSLQFQLANTVATTPLTFVASFINTAGRAEQGPAEQDGVSNNTTAVTLVNAPAPATQTLIKNIVIQNSDTASATVTVFYNNNGTLRNLIVVTLAAGDQLMYDEGNGWSVIDKNGNLKTSGSGGGSTTSTSITPPQGRLTLVSNTPVMTADATAQTSIYYAPYNGNNVPVYNGTNMISYTFSQLTMALNTSNQTSGNIYDIFLFLNSGVLTIGAGPAWSNTTSRGTGAGTTQLQLVSGLWVNANAITLKNGTNSYSSIAANQATYVGSFYCTANGQTGVSLKPAAAAGGNANVMGLYNAYNRINMAAYCRDNTSSWTYGAATWRAANNNSNNGISFLDGLQQSFVTGTYGISISTTGDTFAGYIGLNMDSTSTTPNVTNAATSAVTQSSSSTGTITETFYPLLGLHKMQAVEYSAAASSVFFAVASSQQIMALIVSLDM